MVLALHRTRQTERQVTWRVVHCSPQMDPRRSFSAVPGQHCFVWGVHPKRDPTLHNVARPSESPRFQLIHTHTFCCSQVWADRFSSLTRKHPAHHDCCISLLILNLSEKKGAHLGMSGSDEQRKLSEMTENHFWQFFWASILSLGGGGVNHFWTIVVNSHTNKMRILPISVQKVRAFWEYKITKLFWTPVECNKSDKRVNQLLQRTLARSKSGCLNCWNWNWWAPPRSKRRHIERCSRTRRTHIPRFQFLERRGLRSAVQLLNCNSSKIF